MDPLEELGRRHIEEQLGGGSDADVTMDGEMREMLNGPPDAQLAYVRREMAEMREDLELIREGLRRYIREWMVTNAEPKGPSEN